jgi:Ner family transcriptional regulator
MIDEERHLWIKEALHARGLTFSGIAKDQKVAATTVSIVSRGYRRSRRLEKAIAGALDMTPEQLWPRRYIK